MGTNRALGSCCPVILRLRVRQSVAWWRSVVCNRPAWCEWFQTESYPLGSFPEKSLALVTKSNVTNPDRNHTENAQGNGRSTVLY